MRPTEFGMPTGLSLISLFITLIVLLAALFAKSRPYGRLHLNIPCALAHFPLCDNADNT